MDAVNVDLDEMRARVDSTHSIITSRQRVEAGYKRIKKDSTKSNCNSLLCKSFFEHKLWQIIVHIHTQISRQRGVTIAVLPSDFWLAYLKPWTWPEVCEATVTAEISTMRLDMGDMQEALKAHDAWMEDVSQSLQEVHERCQQLSEDIGEHAQSTQAKFDAKTDITAWNDMNDDIDASIKTVRDMASALRLEVDSRRRKVDEDVGTLREQLKTLTEKVDTNASNIQRYWAESLATFLAAFEAIGKICSQLILVFGIMLPEGLWLLKLQKQSRKYDQIQSLLRSLFFFKPDFA